jgi:hypothetical protein
MVHWAVLKGFGMLTCGLAELTVVLNPQAF